jgi:uncharacterized protein YndB with AHSA1/START domain
MSNSAPDIVQVIYIRATPERTWAALTDPDQIAQYWFGLRGESDWRPGSPFTWRLDGKDMFGGVVEAADPPRRLVLRSGPPGGPLGQTITWVIEPVETTGGEPLIRLTLTNAGLAEDDPARAGTAATWAAIVSNLKTLLETGRPLPAFPPPG